MNFQKKVTKNNYVREYVNVLNGLFNLTPREVDIITNMIKIDINWTPRSEAEVKNILSTDNRRLLLKECNMNKSNFTKIASKLKSIGLLVTSPDGACVVNDLLKPTIIKNKIELSFILDMTDGSTIQ